MTKKAIPPLGGSRSPGLLRAERISAGYKLRDLARLSGCSIAQISLLERGLVRASPDLARRIAGALGVSVRDLFPALEAAAPAKAEDTDAGR